MHSSVILGLVVYVQISWIDNVVQSAVGEVYQFDLLIVCVHSVSQDYIRTADNIVVCGLGTFISLLIINQ